MADVEEGEGGGAYSVELEEFEGDQDLVIASRDFDKIANSRMKVVYGCYSQL